MLLCIVATLRRYTGSRPCTEVTIETPRMCIVLVNTWGVQSDEVKDKVFHALANPRIPLSDRQEKKFYIQINTSVLQNTDGAGKSKAWQTVRKDEWTTNKVIPMWRFADTTKTEQS